MTFTNFFGKLTSYKSYTIRIAISVLLAFQVQCGGTASIANNNGGLYNPPEPSKTFPAPEKSAEDAPNIVLEVLHKSGSDSSNKIDIAANDSITVKWNVISNDPDLTVLMNTSLPKSLYEDIDVHALSQTISFTSQQLLDAIKAENQDKEEFLKNYQGGQYSITITASDASGNKTSVQTGNSLKDVNPIKVVNSAAQASSAPPEISSGKKPDIASALPKSSVTDASSGMLVKAPVHVNKLGFVVDLTPLQSDGYHVAMQWNADDAKYQDVILDLSHSHVFEVNHQGWAYVAVASGTVVRLSAIEKDTGRVVEEVFVVDQN